MKNRPNLKEFLLLGLIALLALLVSGYHPAVEDAEIYLPGVKQVLNPALYPHNAQFFAAHARMTLYPNLMAASVRISHLPLDWMMLLWHLASIFLLLLACWHLGRLLFREPRARWGSVALVASLLSLPATGTALYIMDEYMNPRSLSTPAVLFLIINVVERKFARALLWALFTAAVHPLMAMFGATYAILVLGMNRRRDVAPTRLFSTDRSAVVQTTMLLLPLGLFPPVTDAYREAFAGKPYFFLLRWQWYEWLGIFAPLALLECFRRIARRQQLRLLERMCGALIIYGLGFFAVSLVITISPRFMNLVELQPMRAFHLLYVLFLIFAGGLLVQFVLKNQAWRWAALFLPLCGVMWYSQTQLFPATPHLEWPGTAPRNDWVQAFLWIRQNTPADAYFALDPNHMALPGEDQHGFRAIAERSMLADNVKDRGAVTMFPALAESWSEQVHAQQGWDRFQISDFERLRQEYGVDWVVVKNTSAAGLACAYRNQSLAVCRIQG